MVRKYKRKTPKSDSDNIRRALLAIQNGMSVRAASRDFGISTTTLRRQLRINRSVVTQNTVEEIDVPVVEEDVNEIEESETSSIIASIPSEAAAEPALVPTPGRRQTATATATSTTTTIMTSTPAQLMPFISNFFVAPHGGKTVRVFTFSLLTVTNIKFFSFTFSGFVN